MPDIIHMLPESVANQIAAGEVVQRPASVVKELMENAIDAGATSISLLVKDAGKTSIQVIDNGDGMSETDARMCFERHATSKIKKSEDLFHIMTKGFRGEALASIAAVAQVELKTKRKGATLGSRIDIEGSRLRKQEEEQCSEGTNFLVKNLFFNVPARRYFLKSDPIEFRHIVDEFQRVVLTHPDNEFTLIHNGSEIFRLYKSSRRQRIVNVFGNRYNEKLVPVEENTDIVRVEGFIGKPESSRKTRGEQFFFVNNRFIRSTYLHHAIMGAFDGLLPSGNFPLYLLYLTIDPEQIDINIHPTKTEIKFRDERAIYAILHAAVKRALGKHNISPTLDFEQERGIQLTVPTSSTEIKQPVIRVNPEFNPFGTHQEKKESPLAGWFNQRERSTEGWKELLEINRRIDVQRPEEHRSDIVESDQLPKKPEWDEDAIPFQIFRKYLMVEVEKGLLLVDQQRAHRRVLFERYSRQLETGKGLIQQILFPEEIEISPVQFIALSGIQKEILSLGFDLILTDSNKVTVRGIPADVGSVTAGKLLDEFIEQYNNESALHLDKRSSLAWAMAISTSVKYGQMLTLPEMQELLKLLFACHQPYFSANNKPTMITLGSSMLDQQFL
ncbi:MAG: DNA mismatch repair endonuclease MutL [Crocinitomicaceae bacterium]|nr:DNA mismatch repair endonuclease MutL [Crocinitomicaceae bacterium]